MDPRRLTRGCNLRHRSSRASEHEEGGISSYCWDSSFCLQSLISHHMTPMTRNVRLMGRSTCRSNLLLEMIAPLCWERGQRGKPGERTRVTNFRANAPSVPPICDTHPRRCAGQTSFDLVKPPSAATHQSCNCFRHISRSLLLPGWSTTGSELSQNLPLRAPRLNPNAPKECCVYHREGFAGFATNSISRAKQWRSIGCISRLAHRCHR